MTDIEKLTQGICDAIKAGKRTVYDMHHFIGNEIYVNRDKIRARIKELVALGVVYRDMTVPSYGHHYSLVEGW